jgi:dynein intermediate chain 1
LTARNNEDESSLIGLASGLCFDFNKFDPNIFILGTEEGFCYKFQGRIHKCSKSYSG